MPCGPSAVPTGGAGVAAPAWIWIFTIAATRRFAIFIRSLLAAGETPAAGIEKGSSTPRREQVAKVTQAQIREIAEVKMPDVNAIDIEGAMLQVAGTARSMGIEVVD